MDLRRKIYTGLHFSTNGLPRTSARLKIFFLSLCRAARNDSTLVQMSETPPPQRNLLPAPFYMRRFLSSARNGSKNLFYNRNFIENIPKNIGV